MSHESTPLEKERELYKPSLPSSITETREIEIFKIGESKDRHLSQEISSLFPQTFNQPFLKLAKSSKKASSLTPLRVGVVLSGGQAPGGHNVIIGLYDALQNWHKESQLFGFLEGPKGILDNSYKELSSKVLNPFRNTGGFDLIGSGRTKIENEEDKSKALKTVQTLSLDGLVIIGGDDSNTIAAILAEYFLSKKCTTKVIGVPKTIDGDLRSQEIEISFGFDTATKTYSEMIGNIARDALSAKKYTHFIKLMGRSASHIALECALQVHPNLTLIGEEIAAKQQTLESIVNEIADLIEKRAALGKNYGVILVPEGLIEFIPEINALIKELNLHLSDKNLSQQLDKKEDLSEKKEILKGSLKKENFKIFSFLDERIQKQLLLERDPHGNVLVSQIATEELLAVLVARELKKRRFSGKFSPVTHFFGYEGRAGYPSNFDADYTTALGYVAANLLIHGYTGYIACVTHLASASTHWEGMGVPITSLIHKETRGNQSKPVISKTFVDLDQKTFKIFASLREKWQTSDDYRFPGPLQFFGPPSVTNLPPLILQLNKPV